MKKLSLAKKIGVFFGLVILVVLLSYHLLYKQAKLDNSKEIAEYATKQLSQITNNFTVKMRDYENISQQFLTNQDLNRWLTAYIQAQDNYDVALYNMVFSNYLEGHAFVDPYFHDAMFIDEANPKRKTLTMGEALPDAFVRSFRDTDSFDEIIQADGETIWFSGVQLDDSSNYYLLVGRRIKNLFSGKPLGVLLLVVREKNICTMINDNRYEEDLQWGENYKSDFTLMTDKNGVIIASPFKMNIGNNVKYYLGTSKHPKVISESPENRSYMSMFHKQPVLVVEYPIGKWGWNLLNVIPVAQAEHSALLRGLALLLSYVLLVLGVLGGVWFGHAIMQEGKALLYPGITVSKMAILEDLVSSEQPEPDWLKELNEKEREILALLAQGYTNKQIAGQLFVAEQTIKNYVSIIYSKLDVHDRVQASLKAIEAGLTSKDLKR